VPTWKQRNPDHQPLKCSAEWHLWRHGLALAIYNKAGAITNGGDPNRTFFVQRSTLAKFFDAHYNAVCKAISTLRKEKLFLATDKENHFLYVSHEKYATSHPEKCAARNLVPYQEEADPFVGKLFAIAKGSLKLKEHWLVGMRKYATDEEIVKLFAEQRDKDIARRKAGGEAARFTSANNSFYAVSLLVKSRAPK
jgi:hypothetical protein